MNCKKCGDEFKQSKGFINYCSIKCRNGKNWTEEDKLKKSISAKNSKKVKIANSNIDRNYKKGERKERLQINCLFCYKPILTLSNKRKYHAECWLKCSGGYRLGSSRGKKGWYKNYWCDSSWELAWVIYHLENHIPFERNNEGFTYIFKNKEHKFYPDFIKDGVYYEIKNYNNEIVKAKNDAFPFKLKILYKEDLKIIFDYVVSKYGKDYIKLYDK